MECVNPFEPKVYDENESKSSSVSFKEGHSNMLSQYDTYKEFDKDSAENSQHISKNLLNNFESVENLENYPYDQKNLLKELSKEIRKLNSDIEWEQAQRISKTRQLEDQRNICKILEESKIRMEEEMIQFQQKHKNQTGKLNLKLSRLSDIQSSFKICQKEYDELKEDFISALKETGKLKQQIKEYNARLRESETKYIGENEILKNQLQLLTTQLEKSKLAQNISKNNKENIEDSNRMENFETFSSKNIKKKLQTQNEQLLLENRILVERNSKLEKELLLFLRSKKPGERRFPEEDYKLNFEDLTESYNSLLNKMKNMESTFQANNSQDIQSLVAQYNSGQEVEGIQKTIHDLYQERIELQIKLEQKDYEIVTNKKIIDELKNQLRKFKQKDLSQPRKRLKESQSTLKKTNNKYRSVRKIENENSITKRNYQSNIYPKLSNFVKKRLKNKKELSFTSELEEVIKAYNEKMESQNLKICNLNKKVASNEEKTISQNKLIKNLKTKLEILSTPQIGTSEDNDREEPRNFNSEFNRRNAAIQDDSQSLKSKKVSKSNLEYHSKIISQLSVKEGDDNINYSKREIIPKIIKEITKIIRNNEPALYRNTEFKNRLRQIQKKLLKCKKDLKIVLKSSTTEILTNNEEKNIPIKIENIKGKLKRVRSNYIDAKSKSNSVNESTISLVDVNSVASRDQQKNMVKKKLL